MKRLFVLILCLFAVIAQSRAQTASDLNAGSRVLYSGTAGIYSLAWWGVSGYTYLIQESDDLVNWTYVPIVESGSNTDIRWGFTTTASNTFFKVEYITQPIAQVPGSSFNGPDNNGDGIPDDWELFYYGTTSVSGTSYVPWSNGTITILQAYLQGLNPLDFYHGMLPSLTATSGTCIDCVDSGGTNAVTIQVLDSHNNPMPNAPVIFSIDYGYVQTVGSSSLSQTVEAFADVNGNASINVIAPPWPGITYTVTGQVETNGQSPAEIQFSGDTPQDDPSAPSIPGPTFPNPNNVPEPTLWVETSSTNVANPTFEEFPTSYNPTTDAPIYEQPVKWYLTSTENATLWEVPEGYQEPYNYQVLSGTLSSSGSMTPVAGTETYSGTLAISDTESSYSVISSDYNVSATKLANGQWSGLQTGYIEGSGSYSTAELYTYLPYDSANGYALSPTEEYFAANEDDFTSTDDIVLSNEYPSSQFQTDVLSNLEAPFGYFGGYSRGDTLAWRELQPNSSSFSVGTAKYQFRCTTTGTTSYVFEWYEVFQPDDTTQPIQVTHQEWDTANTDNQSDEFSLDPSTQSSDGNWYIARLDTQTLAHYPGCRWRHQIGVGETVQCSLAGLPSSISGSATWSITPSTSGSFDSISSVGPSKLFIAARSAGNVTITATMPGGATMSTTLAIIAPSGIAYTKVADISMPIGFVGAGMWGQYTLLPTTVSFSGCQYQEEKCPATDPTGYWEHLGFGIWHNPDGLSDPIEPPDTNPNWILIQEDNTGGSLDRAEAGPAEFDAERVLEAYGLLPGGGFTWEIPIRYRCAGDTDNGLLLPETVFTYMEISLTHGSGVIKGTSEGDASATNP
jgi:hypothetical protein